MIVNITYNRVVLGVVLCWPAVNSVVCTLYPASSSVVVRRLRVRSRYALTRGVLRTAGEYDGAAMGCDCSSKVYGSYSTQ